MRRYKLRSFISLCIMAAVAAWLYFCLDGFTMTHEWLWKEVRVDEVSITIPYTMEEFGSLKVSESSKDLMQYGNSEATVFVSKIIYPDDRVGEFMRYAPLGVLLDHYLDVETDGPAIAINNGYYTTYYSSTSDSNDWYNIIAVFHGNDGAYLVKLYCLSENKEKYATAMLKMLETFKVR